MSDAGVDRVQQTDRSRLRVTEIFFSLQGESRTVGYPTIFIRLTGCPLRCGYCDTEYAFQGGKWMTLAEIMNEAGGYQTEFVTVTGGEPLAQRPCRELLTSLCDSNYRASLETSGAVDISDIDERVRIVMDLKTPGSGEESKNMVSNIELLKPNDEIKFVIADRDDYEWSKARIKEYRLIDHCEILFSPVYGKLAPRILADWILDDQLRVRLQVQLHKLLWGEEPGH
jgi:7-carboxy-7-deazaguanine synthase